MNYHDKYEEVLKFIRLQGISVRHMKIPKTVDGRFDDESKRLEICPAVKHTKRGLEVLAHEYCHLIQCENGEFKPFFRKLGKFTQKKLKIVAEAEIDCAAKAKRFLSQFGIEVYPDELKKDKLPGFLAFWSQYYF